MNKITLPLLYFVTLTDTELSKYYNLIYFLFFYLISNLLLKSLKRGDFFFFFNYKYKIIYVFYYSTSYYLVHVPAYTVYNINYYYLLMFYDRYK